MKNQAAVALGKLAAGIPKNYTKAELKRRTERLVAGRRAWAMRQKLIRATMEAARS